MAKNLYIVISSTYTYFGRTIRTFGRIRYNHASIALDEGLNEIYSFGRQKHTALLTGKLVRENITRFTLNKTSHVDVTVFKIPVSEEKYNEIVDTIHTVYNDREYLYNLFSVLTYPLTKGLSVYKAFTCIEFIMYLLTKTGMDFDKPLYVYKPDDLLEMFKDNILYQGNLLEYVDHEKVKTDYFDPMSVPDYKESAICLSKLLVRTVTLRKNELY